MVGVTFGEARRTDLTTGGAFLPLTFTEYGRVFLKDGFELSGVFQNVRIFSKRLFNPVEGLTHNWSDPKKLDS